MAYLVSISPRARRDLDKIYWYIEADESEAAFRWYVSLENAILSLEENPNRCPPTPETRELRHLLFGNKPHIYRVIYRVLEEQQLVEVLHIRHGAQRRFKRTEFR